MAERTISQLCSKVERIGQIASLIADIAGQTNLRALNATIEAARAGDGVGGEASVSLTVPIVLPPRLRETGLQAA